MLNIRYQVAQNFNTVKKVCFKDDINFNYDKYFSLIIQIMMANILCRRVVNDKTLNYKIFSIVDQVVDFKCVQNLTPIL